MKKNIIWGIISLLIVGTILFFGMRPKEHSDGLTGLMPMKVGNITMNVGIADTPALREKGLSGRSGLAPDEGLLFLFDSPAYFGFWMKDMKFPIDMAWISEDKKIVHIEHNVSPDTYPKVFTSTTLSLYVLETPAGFFDTSKIKIGDSVSF